MAGITINHFFLLITSMIWGSAFVFQKTAMDNVDPYLYSSLRFFAGSFFLIPVIFFVRRKQCFSRLSSLRNGSNTILAHIIEWNYLKNLFFEKKMFRSGFIAGIILSFGVNLQQVALYHTQVAKVGFITSFYIILVPIISIFLGRRLSLKAILSAIVAIVGFYFLSYKESNDDLVDSINGFAKGDVITLISSLFWALHIIYIDSCSKKLDNFVFSFLQFFFCAFLTLIFVLLTGRDILWIPIKLASVEIIYGGVVSVGIGYTLQVFGQKRVEPHLAALIVSLESVFAALFEIIILKTFLTPIEIFGCFLLFSAVIYSQIFEKKLK